jgi:XTP/dITP diphosphohydrolase
LKPRAKPSAGTRSAKAPSKPGTGRATRSRRVTFVTGNAGKVAELRQQLGPRGITVVQDKRGYPEVQADTLREVAEAGARHLLADGLRPPFLLEDSGLFVAALRGWPGVYSRHALGTVGIPGLLKLMADVEAEMRTAAFQACLLYVDGSGRPHAFEGACPGRIAERAAGDGGFGFDPVFVPKGEELTFAQMEPAQKARSSHRGKAVRAFLDFLDKTAKA